MIRQDDQYKKNNPMQQKTRDGNIKHDKVTQHRIIQYNTIQCMITKDKTIQHNTT